MRTQEEKILALWYFARNITYIRTFCELSRQNTSISFQQITKFQRVIFIYYLQD